MWICNVAIGRYFKWDIPLPFKCELIKSKGFIVNKSNCIFLDLPKKRDIGFYY